MFKKQDLIIFGVIAALAAAAFIIVRLSGSAPAAYVEVIVDGSVTETHAISENGEYSVEGFTGGTVTFTISDGTVDVISADCPNRICVHHAPISRTGESIVCLPNRVIITLRGRTAQVDATV